MNSRILFAVCLFCLVVGIVMFVPAPGSYIVVSAQGPIVSADEASRSAGAKLTENPGEAAPDARLPGAPTSCGVSPVDCSYYHVSSSVFQGRDSSSTYTYDGSGCFHHTNASVNGFMAPVLITPGSVIKYIRIYYKDTSATDMTVRLRYFDDGVTNNDLTTVSTSGSAAGLRTALSAEITHTIDYINYSYGVLAFETGPTDGTIQLCGLRLAYTQGAFGLALPLITR